MSLPIVRASVRQVVETTYHDSDLSPAAGAAKRMREGAAAHRARQSEGAKREKAYQAEQALSADYEADTLILHVSGRADGLFTREDGVTVVEEIKLGAKDNPLIPAHRAQAAMYGHMLCARDGLSGVRLRILYVDEQGEGVACYEENAAAQALEEIFKTLCAAACIWEEKMLARRQARDASLDALPFPYDSYRAGQRQFAAGVYVAIRDRKRLFAQAPTGIGKTMAALYPALRALGEGKCSRVLYLTARTTGRRSAADALAFLQEQGAKLFAVEIAAKDKLCPQERRDCRAEVCPYADGFYDRLPDAVSEALSGGVWDRTRIEELAQKHRLCPFELALELAQRADVVVCDYNYVYDPFVAIDALLTGGAALLVDEAHQLAPRVQESHSAKLNLRELTESRREAGQELGRKSRLYRAMTDVLHALRKLTRTEAFASGELEKPPEALCGAMDALMDAAGSALEDGAGQAAAQTFTLAAEWQYAASHFDERYAVLTGGGEKNAEIELFLLCAAKDILDRSKKAKGTVYFSATLAPFDAAGQMLGKMDGDACLMLPSPFLLEQLQARWQSIDLRYAAREQSAPRVAELIQTHFEQNSGNTLVFFPSYAYLEQVCAQLGQVDGVRMLREARGMREDEKNALLSAFQCGDERVALLCILGGAFSEGVDLVGERLKNVIVISTGMPQPSARVRAMQRYYDALGANGFDLCMTLPGMVRVIQAAGRLIRSETDTGTLLLIDSRYGRRREREILSQTLIGQALYSGNS